MPTSSPDTCIPSLSATAPTTARPAVALARRAWSVRDKSLIVMATLLVYAIFIASFMLHQKDLLLRQFDDMEQSVAIDAVLKQTDAALFQSVMATYAQIDTLERRAVIDRVSLHYEQLLRHNRELAQRAPQLRIRLGGVGDALAAARVAPDNGNMTRLIQELMAAKIDFTATTARAQQARADKSAAFRTGLESSVISALLLGLLGLTLLGTLTLLFFRRLREDLRTLQRRALQIVGGHAEAPLPVHRKDEVGQLMVAINELDRTLATREHELLIERRKYYHQEKLAAIGSLAAGVAHEIGNPVAIISGITQEIAERRESEAEQSHCHGCRPDLIQAQVQRIVTITREISDFSGQQATDPRLIDLNALVRATVGLMRYDRRMRRVALRYELDGQLPAVYGVADQFTQVVMNLLVNAVDALELAKPPAPTVVLRTALRDGQVCLTISDNGCGMDGPTLAHAFEAFYTTKAPGRGTGLGLALCHSLMQRNGGAIGLESTPGAGTDVRLTFPSSAPTC